MSTRFLWPRTVARLARSRPGAAALAALLLGGTARADDPREFWPELDLYKQHSPVIRYYFVAAYARGKESEFRTLDAAGYVDITVGPKLPRSRQKADWQTKKYFWARIGYDHIFKAEGETNGAPEYRGIVALHARHYLPAAIFVEGRARVDLRWIEGQFSTRYRLRDIALFEAADAAVPGLGDEHHLRLRPTASISPGRMSTPFTVLLACGPKMT